MGEMKRVWEYFTFNKSGMSPDGDVDRVFLGIDEETVEGEQDMTVKKLKKKNRKLRKELDQLRLYARELEFEVAEVARSWDTAHDLLEEAWQQIDALHLQLGADNWEANQQPLTKPEELKWNI